jgi:hypothetical protein
MPDTPEWLDTEAWGDWLQHRKEKGKPVTPLSASKAFEALRAYIDAGHTARTVIDHSIANGYQGLFAPSNTTPKVGNKVQSRHDLSKMNYKDTGDNLPF